MRLLFLLTACLLPTGTRAALDLAAVSRMESACQDWSFAKEKEDTFRELLSWKKESDERIAEIRKFSRQTCPNYVTRANAASSAGTAEGSAPERITLSQFIAAQQAMASHSVATSDSGRRLGDWWKREYAAFDRIHRFVNDHVENKPCASVILGTVRAIEARVRDIRSSIDRIQLDCPGLADILMQRARHAASIPAPTGDGGPGRASSTQAETTRSGITGIAEDQAKRKQGEKILKQP